MPVVAVIAAAGAWAGAATAAGAFITTGALTVAGALEITAAVGATLGAVGAVTGDKGLMTAGMVLGGIGGIGSLAVGAGLFGADAGATTLFGSVPADVAVTPEIVGSNVGGFIGDGGASSIIDSLGGVSTTPVEVSPLPDVTGGVGSVSPALSGGPAADALTAAPTASAGVAPDASLATATPDASAAPTTPASGLVPPVPTVSAPTVPGSVNVTPGGDATSNPGGFAGPAGPSPGIFDTLGNFVKNDKSGMIGYGLIQAGGSLVGGLFDPLKPAQVSQLNANTAQTQAQTGITNTQAANIKAPLPVARIRPPGLINMGAT